MSDTTNMTQEELRQKIDSLALNLSTDEGESEWLAEMVLDLINQHVKEVIGEDEPEPNVDPSFMYRNTLKAEQRKRAGI